MGFAFDEDRRLRPLGEGRFEVELSDRWSIFGVPNGGFVMATVIGAMSEVLPHPDPLSATTHFVARTRPGPAVIETEVVRSGRSFSTVSAVLSQDGSACLRSLAMFGDLERTEGPTVVMGKPPVFEEGLVEPSPENAPPLASRFEFEVPPSLARFRPGEGSGEARLAGRIRFRDGRPPDLLSLPLIVDAFPPAVFMLGLYGWTPTLELTVHSRRRPAAGWLTCSIETRFLVDGLLEEDVEVWDETGNLVGLSRQFARAPG